MRLTASKIEDGMHPSEKLVSVQTKDGMEQLFVNAGHLEADSIPVSHPLEQQNGHQLVELPNETTRGI
jgi:hypothetical protein